MIDYFAKAREGRIAALDLHRSGAVMFFPEGMDDAPARPAIAPRELIAQVNKPMFLRSASVTGSAVRDLPEPAANGPLLLTEDLVVSRVLDKAA
ncbi:hypothetical protein [Celeribacter indicus]|uniref:Uncharacterized protein n=1 Tax=Celeribacter indicus TaxID=1208324 RepID=A0A0B5DQ36_9RHOB|nr:hypothetical protein [Celeribacter indicus]AJE45239.1 hypothetical protein P73_0524 [Celeribacter indicus]SDX21768.1 hypothetical protein SAMN05443573_117103 [Celeribacter indicus]